MNSPSNKPKGIGMASQFSNHPSTTENEVTDCSETDNVIFLHDLKQSPKKETKDQSIHTENTPEHLVDIETMTPGQLSKKYKLTYNSWKNMKSRCKKLGKILDQRFSDFKEFLRLMGPRTDSSYTLDRIDNENPNYGPDCCRWADKETQNQNKGNTISLTYKGETHSLSVWARKTGQKPDTLYHRKTRGWSDEEIISGKANAGDLTPKSLWSGTPWPLGKEETWEKHYQNNYRQNETRLMYLYRFSEEMTYKFHEELRADEYQNPEIGEDIPPKLIEQANYWEALFNRAKGELAAKAKRDKFIKREGAEMGNKEVAIYDHIHGPHKKYSDDS